MLSLRRAGSYTGSLPRPHSPSFRRLPFEGTPVCLLPSSMLDRSRACLGFLSWSSSKTALPPMSPCVSTLGCPRFGVATPEHVPPVSFFPTAAACSTHGFAGLLHPATGRRVRLVSRRRSTSADPRRSPGVSFPFEALRQDSGFPVARFPSSSSLFPMTEAIVHPTSRRCSILESRTDGVATLDATSSLGVPSTQAFTGGLRCRRLPLGSQLPGALRIGLSCCLRIRSLPRSGRCVRREHLPTHTFADAGRGVRDGYRVSHGHLRLPATRAGRSQSSRSRKRVIDPEGSPQVVESSRRNPFPGVITDRALASTALPKERAGSGTEAPCPPGQVEGLARQRPRER